MGLVSGHQLLMESHVAWWELAGRGLDSEGLAVCSRTDVKKIILYYFYYHMLLSDSKIWKIKYLQKPF